jgi:hypothetical protein
MKTQHNAKIGQLAAYKFACCVQSRAPVCAIVEHSAFMVWREREPVAAVVPLKLAAAFLSAADVHLLALHQLKQLVCSCVICW